MVDNLTYRTDDGTRWGGGQGFPLSAVQVDLNFWSLFFAVAAVEDALLAQSNAGIDFISQPVGGNQFFVHLTDHRVLGPFTIPTAQWSPKGEWQPNHAYSAFDVVSHNGSVYLVSVSHTSGATFSALSTDGLGHPLYMLLLSTPANSLPSDGTIGQRLARASSSPFVTEWVSDKRVLFVQVNGHPDANELLLQYPVVDHSVLPASLVGSAFFEGIRTVTAVSYTLTLNGSAIGSIDFSGGSPETITVTLGRTVLIPGDVLALTGPSVPDGNQSDISFSIVSLLTE